MEQPSFSEGICFYHRQYKGEFGEKIDKVLLVDDKTAPGNTLALRRLYMMKNKANLKKLGKAVFFLGDLVKLAHRKSWFIDSNGEVFQYKKTKTARLIFKPVTKMIPIATGGVIVEVLGIPNRFKTLHNPKPGEVYAGVLIDGMYTILYGLYTEQHQDTWRMI